MARSVLAVQTPTFAGIVPAFTAANVDGHSIANDGSTVLHVKNGGGAPINVTCQTPAKFAGLDVAEDIVSVSNGSEKIIGPFSPAAFNQGAGEVYVDFSAITSVTVAAIKVTL
jgi:hypothetical protein